MSKRKKEKVKLGDKERTTVKYVAKAGAWCTSVFHGGTQRQTWTKDKP